MKSFALALGAGGARGFAHVAVLEALDEMGLRPAAIAGCSIGAMAGALYSAGMSGKEIRRYVIDLVHNRGEFWRRLMLARAGTLANLFSGDPVAAMRLDPAKLVSTFLPDDIPQTFDQLRIPLMVVASDLHARREIVFNSGPLLPALAASIALPTVVRPMVIGNRVFIDGAATNPLPFDLLRGSADVIVAVDVSGPPPDEPTGVPKAIEALYATVMVMTDTIINEKLKHEAPDLLLRPNVSMFRVLDFFQASAILRVAEPVRQQLKAELALMLNAELSA